MPSLELISVVKNAFGDTFYYLREQNGAISRVFEGDLKSFMQKRGVSELTEGAPFLYPTKKR